MSSADVHIILVDRDGEVAMLDRRTGKFSIASIDMIMSQVYGTLKDAWREHIGGQYSLNGWLAGKV